MKMSASRALAAALGAVVLLGSVPDSREQASVVTREVCRLLAVRDPTMTHTHVSEPARATFRRWHGMVAGASSVTITVNYSTNFPAAAKPAFQSAVDIWAAQISSSVPIVIEANWVPQASGLLGIASAAFVYRDESGLIPSVFYFSALANKLHGSDLDTDVDIIADFNSARPDWFFGTDGNTPVGQYDFKSVVLHELGHGLGFSGTASSTGSSGTIGQADIGGTFPYIFDRFTESAARQSLLNTAVFPNPSFALHQALTSDGPWSPGQTTPLDPNTGIYWNGAAGVAAAGGGTNRPRLDANAPFDDGSNFSHLNDITYPKGNANSLMTRALSDGESIHAPGPLTLAIFQDEGWSPGCSYALSASSALVLPAASTGSVNVTAPAGCAWSATAPSGSFVTITGGASGIGNGTVSYSVAAAPSSTPRSTTLTIAGLPYVVTQGAQVAIDHATLNFGAVSSGGTLTTATPAQSVVVSISGASGLAWTAAVTSSSPWLVVTGGSGTGTGTFSVSVQSHASLASVTSATGTITVTASGTANSPKTIAVNLALVPPGTANLPVGSFDTPIANATLQGSVAVTGWALDNIGISKVEVLRDAHPTDPAGAVVNGRVFIGLGTLIDGARPDVEAAAPGSPMNYRAGWGYLMLTRGLVWDGQGPFRLHAQATDIEGNVVTLGSKMVTVNNATAMVPFGAIDIPGQGATVGGAFPNTGWVLSPGTTVPASGLLAAIDGQFLSAPVLLQGNTYMMADRSDITTGFPGFNTTGAGRGNVIDTSGYANGVHTIGWLVTDALGRADGVGSRFFKIQNGSLTSTTTASASLMHHPESALAGIDTGAAVRVATGMNPKAPLKTVRPDAFGRRHVRIAEMDRVEVRVTGKSQEVYMVANGQLRGLPIGATFNRTRGTLYWQPGAGYVGDYEFVVVDQSRRDARRLTRVVVTVGPPRVAEKRERAAAN